MRELNQHQSIFTSTTKIKNKKLSLVTFFMNLYFFKTYLFFKKNSMFILITELLKNQFIQNDRSTSLKTKINRFSTLQSPKEHQRTFRKFH